MVRRIVTILALVAAVATMSLAGAVPAVAASSAPSHHALGASYYLSLGGYSFILLLYVFRR